MNAHFRTDPKRQKKSSLASQKADDLFWAILRRGVAISSLLATLGILAYVVTRAFAG